ncbi:MAG: phosphoenolpyruvate carboxykinase (ATP) [Candidatus Gastranaerophilales bacterium]|nr:phosphoenolpyruvate carboxykinase (ATP) [Candidatus Gastranaerophilales bacterium]
MRITNDSTVKFYGIQNQVPQKREETSSKPSGLAPQPPTIPSGQASKAYAMISFGDSNVFKDNKTQSKEIANEVISNAASAKYLTKSQLIQESLEKEGTMLTKDGSLVIDTEKYTGRTPGAKFFVATDSVKNKINWDGSNNIPISRETADEIVEKIKEHLKDKDLYLYDGQVGSDDDVSLGAKFINTSAAQSLFVKNMFREPSENFKKNSDSKLTVISAPEFKLSEEDRKKYGLNSEVLIIVDVDKGLITSTGSKYSGENKKSVFSLMNYLSPQKGILPMHCSANVGNEDDVALFFGLSGTGKTTLSADPLRSIIGDDEHLWSDKGVSNIEGGCYAKMINLSEENEPDIYQASNRRGALLENVPVNAAGTPFFSYDMKNPEFVNSLREPEFAKMLRLPEEYIQKLSNEKTFEATIKDEEFLNQLNANQVENTRSSYPVEHIGNALMEGKVNKQPKNVIFLTYDASGIMPPVAKLSPEQAKYFFMSGYTSKVAGTERGIKEPQSTFSACFGAPFMPLHPVEYANLLENKINKVKESGQDCNVWLINTGLIGGAYGKGGERISIKNTRNLLNSILDGDLKNAEFDKDKTFGFEIPKSCTGVDSQILNPKNAWADKEAYEETAKKLAGDFIKNFKKYENNPDAIKLAEEYGPKID